MSFEEHTEDNIIFPRCETSFSQDVPLINLNVKTAKDVKKISLKLITYVEQRLESEMMHASLNPAFSMELVSTLFLFIATIRSQVAVGVFIQSHLLVGSKKTLNKVSS